MIKFTKTPYRTKVSYIAFEFLVSINDTSLGTIREYLPRLSWPDEKGYRFPIDASYEADIVFNPIKNFKTFEEAKDFVLTELQKYSKLLTEDNVKDYEVL